MLAAHIKCAETAGGLHPKTERSERVAPAASAVFVRGTAGILASPRTTVLHSPSRTRGRKGWRSDCCARRGTGGIAGRKEVRVAE